MTRISVVMAVYNGEAYVAEAIDSVLDQSRPPDEFIVVDDGSTDGTSKILDRYSDRIVRLSQENSGQTAALNRAIARASGDLLAFQDADDIWCERKLERQVAALIGNPDTDAVFGLMRQFVSPDVPIAQQQGLAPAQELCPGEIRVCMLIRKSQFRRIGPFDATFPAVSFIEWLGRAKQMGLRSVMLSEVVARRRLHLNNYGRRNVDSRDDQTLNALRRVIVARKRASRGDTGSNFDVQEKKPQ
jgi:glycosyltransferase involved in cell wall biosynthesis